MKSTIFELRLHILVCHVVWNSYTDKYVKVYLIFIEKWSNIHILDFDNFSLFINNILNPTIFYYLYYELRKYRCRLVSHRLLYHTHDAVQFTLKYTIICCYWTYNPNMECIQPNSNIQNICCPSQFKVWLSSRISYHIEYRKYCPIRITLILCRRPNLMISR